MFVLMANCNCFYWEYIVLAITQASHECIDIFIERARDTDIGANVVETYLEAMRYLFGICNMLHTSQAKFRGFAETCSKFFPNIRVYIQSI